MPGQADLVVMGGGPAGSISALLAARDGLCVLLVDPDRTTPRLEGMSPRLRQWLQGQGLLEGFPGLAGPFRRETAWSGLSQAANGEYVVERAALDRWLRNAAQAAGAEFVRTTCRPDAEGVTLTNGDVIHTPRIIDARGRNAHRERRNRCPATLAICGWASAAGIQPGIRIAAMEQGWLWRIALPNGRVWAQFTSDAAQPGNLDERLRHALTIAEPDGSGIVIEGSPLAREAAPLLPCLLHDLRILPVGDALAAMDPLSGHGQFWAVSSALAAAAVRRSLDARPGEDSESLCRRYLHGRAMETCLRNARTGRDFIRMETRFAESPFWAMRRNFPDDQPAHEKLDACVLARAPVVRNGLIEEMDILRTPRSPMGIGWFAGIPASEAWQVFSRGGAAALHQKWGPAAARLKNVLLEEMEQDQAVQRSTVHIA
jgi:flavin-dependent dehydrogenase